ncbi:MAG: hypothetical protein AB1505_09665 [Candidatus Latescibacterota bacterium]
MKSQGQDERVLAGIDLAGVEATWLWHRYSSGAVEKERLGAWRDAFVHAHWQPHTYWAAVPDLERPGSCYLLCRLGDRMLLTGERQWRDYTVRAGVRQFHSFNISPSVNLAYRQDCLCGLVCRLRDVRAYYLFSLENYDRATLYRVEDDNLWVLGQEPVAIDRARFHRMSLACRGDRLVCAFDGRQIIAARDDAYPMGWAGLRANAKSGFRDVAVTTDEPGWQAYVQTRDRHARELDELRSRYPQPVLERHVPPPLTGSGSLQLRRVDAEDAWGFFWLTQGRHNPSQVAAATVDGQALWSAPLEGGDQESPFPASPKAYDVDRDGYDELVLIDAGKVKVLSGRSGELLAEAPMPLAGPLMGVPGQPAPISYHYAVAFRPAPAPLDIILLDGDAGGGRNVWCYDHQLRLRWHALLPFPFGHNMCFYDVDGDGRQEAMLGHCLLDGEGRILWSIEEMHYAPHGAMGIHADSVVIGDLEGNGTLRLASVSGDDGVLFVDARSGQLLRRDRIGHAQGISAARYLRDEPGIQVLAGTRHRAYGIFALYNGRGDRLFRWQPDLVNQGGRPVNWQADGEELLLLSSPDLGHGLFDAWGRLVVPFPAELAQAGGIIPHALADDPRDRLLAVGPGGIAVFGPDRLWPAGQERAYRPLRDYWRGGTLGVISHPAWGKVG